MDRFSHRKGPYYYVIGAFPVDKKIKSGTSFSRYATLYKSFCFSIVEDILSEVQVFVNRFFITFS